MSLRLHAFFFLTPQVSLRAISESVSFLRLRLLRTALRKGWNGNWFEGPPPCVFHQSGDLLWLWIGIWSKVLCDSYSSMEELVFMLVELTQQRQQEQQKSTYLVKSQICDFCTLCRPYICFFIYIYTYGREEIGFEVQKTKLNFIFTLLSTFSRPVKFRDSLCSISIRKDLERIASW